MPTAVKVEGVEGELIMSDKESGWLVLAPEGFLPHSIFLRSRHPLSGHDLSVLRRGDLSTSSSCPSVGDFLHGHVGSDKIQAIFQVRAFSMRTVEATWSY